MILIGYLGFLEAFTGFFFWRFLKISDIQNVEDFHEIKDFKGILYNWARNSGLPMAKSRPYLREERRIIFLSCQAKNQMAGEIRQICSI